jgi:hypothetical protein
MPRVVGAVHEVSFGYGGLVGVGFEIGPGRVVLVTLWFAEDSV